MRFLIKLAFVASAIVLVLFAYSAFGQVVVGDTYHAQVVVCRSLQSAVSVAKADERGGPEAALKAVEEIEDCGIAVLHIKIGGVKYKVKTERGETLVLSVEVEMRDGSWKTAYILTDQPVSTSKS